MAAITRNSCTSGAVMLLGFLLSFIGIFEPTQILIVTGLTLLYSGMIQLFSGAVLEVEKLKRYWPILIGIPFSIFYGYVYFRSSRDDLPNGYWICGVIFITLIVQIVISYITFMIWKNRQQIETH